MKKIIIICSTISFLVLLLLFPNIALKGAKTGLMLWFQTVLPTLLPFMIVSNLIMQLKITDCLTSFFYPLLGKPLGLSKSGCYPMLIGMLSGYPVGAKACSDLIATRQLSCDEGQYLLCFCNNASPMFLLSFIAMQCLCVPKPMLILVILYSSALITGQIYRILYRKRLKEARQHSSINFETTTSLKQISVLAILDQTILSSFEILVKVGGYIILFSILAELVIHLTFIASTFRYSLIGFLEITTGSATISFSNFSLGKKIVLINALTAFGGLSSHAQTYSVVIHSGLSMKKYFFFKCIHACIAGVLSLLLVNCI